MSTMTEYRINASGLASIAEQLKAKHNGFRTDDPTEKNLLAWAVDAQLRADEGDKYPEVEIRSWDAICGHTDSISLSRAHDFDAAEVEIEE